MRSSRIACAAAVLACSTCSAVSAPPGQTHRGLVAAARLRGGANPKPYTWEDRHAQNARDPRRGGPPGAAGRRRPRDDDEGYRSADARGAARRGGPPAASNRALSRHRRPAMVHALVFLNLAAYGAGRFLPQVKKLPQLGLDHNHFKIYQLLTSLFQHADAEHLMSNMFALLVFGSVVEEEHGTAVLLSSFLLCGAISNVMMLVWDRKADNISLGSSAGIFGLFAITLFSKLYPKGGIGPRGLIEAAVFGYYILSQVVAEVNAHREGRADNVAHFAHISGITAGALLVFITRNAAGAKIQQQSNKRRQKQGSGAARDDQFDGPYDDQRRPPRSALREPAW